MKVSFTKMQGLGNDFVIIDALQHSISLTPTLIKKWANRHLGIGFDQLLLLEAPFDKHYPFLYRIFNADGNEVEQCGNGARCIARYAYDKGLIKSKSFHFETRLQPLAARIEADGQVTIDMGPPHFSPPHIPFLTDEEKMVYSLPLKTGSIAASVISMGNPHCVIEVPDINTAPLSTVGEEIAQASFFPAGVNVGFMQLISSHHIKLRVLERGAGETLACGSGACAAVVAGQRINKLAQQVKVDLPGGQLFITWQGNNSSVWMTGPACYVFKGEIDLP